MKKCRFQNKCQVKKGFHIQRQAACLLSKITKKYCSIRNRETKIKREVITCGIVRETNVKNGERFIFNLDQSQRPAQEKLAREYWYDFCQDPRVYTTKSQQKNPSYQHKSKTGNNNFTVSKG